MCKINWLTRKLLLELPDLHCCSVGGEADGVERHKGLEGAHHLWVVPVCRLRLVTGQNNLIYFPCNFLTRIEIGILRSLKPCTFMNQKWFSVCLWEYFGFFSYIVHTLCSKALHSERWLWPRALEPPQTRNPDILENIIFSLFSLYFTWVWGILSLPRTSFRRL